ncbi:MAG: biopolymer transporter ExbD [Candidatus Kapabacteria bacterium]|nr:biopolymer transporter ExbD [Candidatus Kapabacteria bacterium]
MSREKRGKQSNRKKAVRVGFKVDMTPLVDITFLLLTFFLFTTTMMRPQIMEMRIPPESTIDGEDVKVKGSELFFILVREDGTMFYQIGQSDGTMTEPQKADIKKLRETTIKQNIKPSIEPNRLITVLKIDPKAKYKDAIKVLNELNLAEVSITAEVMKKDDPATGKKMERKRKFTFGKLTEEEVQKIAGL